MSCVSRRLVGALHVPLSYLLMVLTGVDLGPDGAPSGKYSLVLAKAAAAASRRSLPVRASAGSDTCANTSGFPRPFLLGGKNGSGCRSFSAAASSARSSRDFRVRSAHAPGSYGQMAGFGNLSPEQLVAVVYHVRHAFGADQITPEGDERELHVLDELYHLMEEEGVMTFEGATLPEIQGWVDAARVKVDEEYGELASE